MDIFRNPEWIASHIYNYYKFEDIPSHLFFEINRKLDRLQSDSPIVSIVICAYNEETNILNCVSSLAAMRTSIPLEIIVINNNSSDKTQYTIDNLNVKSYFQGIQGWGPARQLGQEKASGKYILLADADCIYSDCWVDKMLAKLEKHNTVCVYGRYSFISEKGYPRWQLFIYERLKDVIAEVRHFKRPYLNSYGLNMGYRRDLGIKIGYVNYMIRGDEGRICFDMMKYGKIKQVKSGKARLWTGPRTLQKDGSLTQALVKRIQIESKRFFSMFRPHPPHDTKNSTN